MNLRVPPKTFLLVVLIASLCANEALARKWTDITGKFSIEADFVELAGGEVALKKSDGQLIRLPLEKLSEADRQHVRSLTTPVAPSQPPSSGRDKPMAAPPETTPPQAGAPASGDGATQTVIAEGVGTNVDDALKDALRTAVNQVVGTVVDAETLVKNDELIEDKILMYSNAFVKTYERISEKDQGGLIRVKIRAAVERRSLIAKLKAENVTVKDVDGASLFGEAITKLEEQKGAEALLRKALEGFPGNCLKAEVVGKPKLINQAEHKATVQITVEYKADPAACKAFGAPLQALLEKIARKKSTFSVVSQKSREFRYGLECFQLPINASWLPRNLTEVFRVEGSRGGYNYSEGPYIGVALNTLTSKLRDRMEWSFYVLDENLRDVFLGVVHQAPICKTDLLNSNGEPILVDRFEFDDRVPFPRPTLIALSGAGEQLVYTSKWTDNPRNVRIFLISEAIFFHNSCYAYSPTVTITRDVQLTLDELKLVSSIKCELQFTPE